MRDYAERCQHIARMFSIGRSVEGRPMWALEISKTPGKVEAKPNARIIGNMHGDEPASRFAFLYLHHYRLSAIVPGSNLHAALL